MERVKGALNQVGYALPNIDPRAGRIFVTSGNGVVGSRVATRLIAAAFPTVRIGVRDPQADVDLAKEDEVEVVEFDWDKEETYAKALDGVKTVFCSVPHHEGWDERFTSFLKACKHAGVKNIVKLSAYRALIDRQDASQEIGLVTMHGELDNKVMKSQMDYTLLFASHLMSNHLVYQGPNIRKEHKLYGASANKAINYVSPNDIADVAVHALLAPKDHHRVGYTLTGPTPLKDTEVVDMLGVQLGKSVTYVDQSIEDFEKTISQPGWPVRDLVALEWVKSSCPEEELKVVVKDVDKVCGRSAESFEEYLLAKDYMTPKELVYLLP